MQKIQSSYKDPSSSVFRDDNSERYFRALRYPPSLYNDLGVFPKVLNTSLNGHFEVEKIPFVNYYYEWTFDQFKDSAIYFLELLKLLDTKGYTFSDATPLNITYNGKGEFIFIDHGSLIKKEGERWTAFYQFIKEYAYPLLYLSDNPALPPLGLLPLMGSKDWMFNYKPRFLNRFSFKYALLRSALTLSSKRSLTDFKEIKKAGISSQFQYNIEFFLDYIRGLQQKLPRDTRWGNYYSETVLGNEYLVNKQKAFLELFEKISPEVKIGVSLGSNDGLMSQAVLSKFPDKKIICLEADNIASKALYSKSKLINIIPVYNSIYSLSPQFGFSESIQSLSSRLSESADFVKALGIIHHMMHEENLSFEKILEFLFNIVKPSGYVMVEFIDSNDPRYKLIQNPSYPYPTTLLDWESSVAGFGTVVKKISLTAHRVLYLIKRH